MNIDAILRGLGGISPNISNTDVKDDQKAAKEFCDRLLKMTSELSIK